MKDRMGERATRVGIDRSIPDGTNLKTTVERAKYIIRAALVSKEPTRDHVSAREIRYRLRDPDHTARRW
jgi:hypothetical protein